MEKFNYQPVTVTSFGFDRRGRSFPRRIEWQGQTYHFSSYGLWLSVRKSGRVTRQVTCNDGAKSYCLRQTGQLWEIAMQ